MLTVGALSASQLLFSIFLYFYFWGGGDGGGVFAVFAFFRNFLGWVGVGNLRCVDVMLFGKCHDDGERSLSPFYSAKPVSH